MGDVFDEVDDAKKKPQGKTAAPATGKTNDVFDQVAKEPPLGGTGSDNPSVWQVLTQPTDKTDQEAMSYKGPAGVAGATIKGLDDVAHSTQDTIVGAGRSAWNGIKSAFDINKPPPIVSVPIDAAKSVYDLGKQALQVPSAIHDINAGPAPAERYLSEVAQPTVSQGAGQAITALGTEGLGKTVSSIPKSVITAPIRAGARATETTLNTGIKPILKVMTPADEAIASRIKVPGRDLGLSTPAAVAPPPPESPMAKPFPTPGPTPIRPSQVQSQLEDSLGATKAPKLEPNVKLKDQLPALKPSGPPPAAESSVIKKQTYDPDSRTLEVHTHSGSGYRYADVAPEDAQAFAEAKSKGQAWNAFRNKPGVVPTEKLVNGKWVPIKPVQMATPTGAPTDIKPLTPQAARLGLKVPPR